MCLNRCLQNADNDVRSPRVPGNFGDSRDGASMTTDGGTDGCDTTAAAADGALVHVTRQQLQNLLAKLSNAMEVFTEALKEAMMIIADANDLLGDDSAVPILGKIKM